MMNVLLITCDQYRHDAVENDAPGDPLPSAFADQVKTPHLAELARGGVRFTECHSPDPICVPARVSITTGKYPHKATGTKANAGAVDDAKHACLAAHFAAHGYDTAAFGKLHYSPYTPPGEPDTLHGFQHAELYEEGRILALFDPDGKTRGLEAYHDWLAEGPWAGYERAHGIGNNDVHPAPSPLPAEFHESSWAVDRTLKWLRERGDPANEKPFLVWTSLARPHTPFDPPRPWDTTFDPREMTPPTPEWEADPAYLEGSDEELRGRFKEYGWDKLSAETVQVIRAHYAGLVGFQDACLGRLFEYLKESGQEEDTVVLFTADHGEMLGDMRSFLKACLYDASVKVPLILRFPGNKNPGARLPQLVGLQDVFPTLCSLAGIPVPEGLDGIDLSRFAAEPDTKGRESLVAYCLEPPQQKIMLRRGSWKYVYCEAGPTEELYDLAADPGESANLTDAAEQAERKAAMRAELLQWCRDHGDASLLDGDDFTVAPPRRPDEAEFAVGKLGQRKY